MGVEGVVYEKVFQFSIVEKKSVIWVYVHSLLNVIDECV